MVLTREQVDRYEKCWNGEDDCEGCSLRAKPGQSSYNGCTATGQMLIDTIRHYMKLAETNADNSVDSVTIIPPETATKQHKPEKIGHDEGRCDE